MAKFKHLPIDERHDIEQCLNKQKSFKEIGKMLNRDPTTISKEVVGHIKVRNVGGKSYPFNACKKRNVCKKVQSVCKPCHHPYTRDLFCARCTLLARHLWVSIEYSASVFAPILCILLRMGL